MSRRCIVLESTRNSLAKVSEFGELVYVFPPNGSRPSIFDFERFSLDIENKLEDLKYDPEKDLIVIAGGLVAMSTFVAVLSSLWGKFKVLVFDSKRDNYFESAIGLEVELEPEKENYETVKC